MAFPSGTAHATATATATDHRPPHAAQQGSLRRLRPLAFSLPSTGHTVSTQSPRPRPHGWPLRGLTQNPDIVATLASLPLPLLNGRGHVAGQHLLPATCPRRCSTQGAPSQATGRLPTAAPQHGKATRRRAPPRHRLWVPDVGRQGRGQTRTSTEGAASSPPATRSGQREMRCPATRTSFHPADVQAQLPWGSPRTLQWLPVREPDPAPCCSAPLWGEGKRPLPSRPPGLGQCPSGPQTAGPLRALPAAAQPPVFQGQLWPPLPAALPSETQGRCRLSTLTAPQPSRGVLSARTCQRPAT